MSTGDGPVRAEGRQGLQLCGPRCAAGFLDVPRSVATSSTGGSWWSLHWNPSLAVHGSLLVRPPVWAG